jgi:hypothetical protein
MFENSDVVQHDAHVVATSRFRCSKILWALKVGAFDFVCGWRNGKSRMEILKEVEDDMEDLLVGLSAYTRPLFDEMRDELRGLVRNFVIYG